MVPRSAPSAIRMPISWVWREIVYRLVEHAAKFEPRLHLSLGLGILGGIGASER
jgi:hypothetical protein